MSRAPKEAPTVIDTDAHFAIIPEWLLRSGVTGNAVKLYGILRRYADNTSMQAFPSRKTLAERMHFKNAKTVDPILKELADVGALTITHRVNEKGERQTSIYTVHTTKSALRGYPLESHHLVPENGQGVVPENGQELIASFNSEPLIEAPAQPDAPKHPADLIAKNAYDKTHGALKYMAVRAVARWAVDQKQADSGAVEKAMAELYKMGKPVTNTTVGQFLDGHIGNQKPAADTSWMTR